VYANSARLSDATAKDFTFNGGDIICHQDLTNHSCHAVLPASVKPPPAFLPSYNAILLMPTTPTSVSLLPNAPTLLFDWANTPTLESLNRDSPDESQIGINVRVFPTLLQDRREVLTATSTSGNPNAWSRV
jgi:hypothetical protein